MTHNTLLRDLFTTAARQYAGLNSSGKLWRKLHPCLGWMFSCVLAQAMPPHAGAFVAGLGAGHAYNDFPWMNGQWVPDEYWAMPGWRGFFENAAAVQLQHRVLAGTTLASVLATWAVFRGRPMPVASKQLLNALLGVTGLQVGLSSGDCTAAACDAYLPCCADSMLAHAFCLPVHNQYNSMLLCKANLLHCRWHSGLPR